MAEDDRLASAPVLEVDPRAVLRREPVHRAISFRPKVGHRRSMRRASERVAIRCGNGEARKSGHRAGVEIDTRTDEELERLKDPLGCNHP